MDVRLGSIKRVRSLLASLALLPASSACLNSPMAQIEELGFIITPYVDLEESVRTGGVIKSDQQSTFKLGGSCGEPGGLIEIIEPNLLLSEKTLCTLEQKWEITLDLSSFPDSVMRFSVRHTRSDSDRYTEIFSQNFFKITAAPTAPAPTSTNSGVTPSQGALVVITWEAGKDSAGQPLVSYEYSVTSSNGQTTFEPWTSVGNQTQAQIAIPAGASSNGDVFVVKIRGTDQASQTTPEQSVSVTVDSEAPTFAGTLSNPASQVNSLNQGPNLSWSLSNFSDAGSGISHQRYRITKTSDSSTVRNWTSLSLDQRALTPTSLSLEAGATYLFELQGVDLAGNPSSSLSSSWTAVQWVPTLVFQSVPTTANSGQNFSVVVHLTQGNSSLVTSPDSSVSLTAFQDAQCLNSASGSLSGSSVTSASGVATFSALTQSTAGTLYLKASAAGYGIACSPGISVTDPPAGIPITITSTSTSSATQYPVRFLLDTATLITQGRLSSTCGNLRFRSSDGLTSLPYWIEEGCNTATTAVWVKAPSVPASSSTQILLILGSLSDLSQSDGFSVFPIFDDFTSSTFDTTRWSKTATTTVSSGRVLVQGGYINSINALPGTGPIAMEAKVEIVSYWASDLYASFQTGFTTTPGSYVHYWGWYYPSSYNGHGSLNNTSGWVSPKHAGITAGHFRLKTSLVPAGIIHSVTPYPGTSFTAFTYTRSGTPNYTLGRKLNLNAPYSAPSFRVDWVLGRETLSPEPTVSVGALQ